MSEKKKVTLGKKEEEEKKPDILGYVVLGSGEKVAALAEEGKYYLCKGRRFRKAAVRFAPAERRKESGDE